MSRYYDIVLSDIQLHVQKPRKPESFLRKVMKSIRSGKPGRAYSKISDFKVNADDTFELPIAFSPEEQAKFDQAKAEGKQIRIFRPKGGLNIYAGKDVVEYMKAHPEKLLRSFDD